MDPQAYEQVFQLFEDSLEREAGERTDFIRKSCEDTTIAVEAIKLVQAHENAQVGGFLDQPMGGEVNRNKLLADVTSQSTLEVPKTIGGFEIIEEIGRGGMSVVYKARQAEPNRIVALKVFVERAFTDRTEVERFRKEADALGELKHPGIVPVFQSGSDSGIHFLAMEFVEGQDLAELARDNPMPARQAAEIVANVAMRFSTHTTKGSFIGI